MANTNIIIGAGETKTITYKTKGTYLDEDMTFTITSQDSTPTDHKFSDASVIRYKSPGIILDATNVAYGERSYAIDLDEEYTINQSEYIQFVFNENNDRTEHYFCFHVLCPNQNKFDIAITANCNGYLQNIILPVNYRDFIFEEDDMVEISFIPVFSSDKKSAVVVCTISNNLKYVDGGISKQDVE